MGTHVSFISEGVMTHIWGPKPVIFRGFGVQRYKAMLVFREAQKIFAKPCWYVFIACIYLPTENKIIGCCVAHHLCLSDGMKTNKTKAGKEKKHTSWCFQKSTSTSWDVPFFVSKSSESVVSLKFNWRPSESSESSNVSFSKVSGKVVDFFYLECKPTTSATVKNLLTFLYAHWLGGTIPGWYTGNNHGTLVQGVWWHSESESGMWVAPFPPRKCGLWVGFLVGILQKCRERARMESPPRIQKLIFPTTLGVIFLRMVYGTGKEG